MTIQTSLDGNIPKRVVGRELCLQRRYLPGNEGRLGERILFKIGLKKAEKEEIGVSSHKD